MDLGKVYGEALAAAKITVTITESITKTLTEKVTLTKTTYTISTTTKMIPITETFTKIESVYHTRTTEITQERPSITLMALIAVVLLGLCLLIALALLLGRRRK